MITCSISERNPVLECSHRKLSFPVTTDEKYQVLKKVILDFVKCTPFCHIVAKRGCKIRGNPSQLNVFHVKYIKHIVTHDQHKKT